MNSKEAIKRLKELVDEETFLRILEVFSGSIVYFPSNTEWTDKDSRNEQIKDDFYSGLYDIPDLAKKYDLSISRVYKIIQSR